MRNVHNQSSGSKKGGCGGKFYSTSSLFNLQKSVRSMHVSLSGSGGARLDELEGGENQPLMPTM